jgi:hypothetical protein
VPLASGLGATGVSPVLHGLKPQFWDALCQPFESR